MPNKYVVVSPDGTISKHEDPGEGEARYQFFKSTVGGIITSQMIEPDDNIIAIVHDEGLYELPMNRRFSCFAGPLILAQIAYTEDDEQWVGFDEKTINPIVMALEGMPIVSEEEAEMRRKEILNQSPIVLELNDHLQPICPVCKSPVDESYQCPKCQAV